ncbi:MAG TPA: SpoIIE family protein phosphatase [Pyrinomonadaceae bacterium]|nr:SpoIIE family protein phosphatase [Pyrinomonadaceae bacterium]
MSKTGGGKSGLAGASGAVRAWLRRVMPRVAAASGALLVLWLLLVNTRFDETTPDNLLDTLAFCGVLLTCVYFGARALLWAKRKLLWRVRRRLIVTYLFVGVTPIVLLGLLGVFSAYIASGQAMSRIVTAQVVTTERHALAHARSLADDFARLPQNASDEAVRAWLDARASALQPSLPGARVALWRAPSRGAGAYEEAGRVGQTSEAEFASAPDASDEARGVGDDATAADSSLPAWLEGQGEWGGFTFLPPRTEGRRFGSPSVRAVVRREVRGRGVAVALTVPVSRALVSQMRDTTGINVRPYFMAGQDLVVDQREDGSFSIKSRGSERGGGRVSLGPTADAGDDAARREDGERVDQFGERLDPGSSYFVVLPSTNWETGKRDARLAFMFSFSFREARNQLLGTTGVGRILQRILAIIAVAFLVLELVALLAAAWMTRAVTGMVHKLHLATEFVKRGDFSRRISTRSTDQLGDLALAFNEMSANIESLLAKRVEHERLERELEIAAEVQAQLFPRSVPALRTAEMVGECRAARGVAGDYYDYIEVVPGLITFALGDVSGKGVSASLVMSNLQAALRAQVAIIAERLKMSGQVAAVGVAAVAPSAASSSVTSSSAAASPTTPSSAPSSSASTELALEAAPCGVTGIDTGCAVENMVAQVNHQLVASTDANRFATLFLALYDDGARTLRYTSAGHNPAILVRAGGHVERLDRGGTLVGAFEWARYEEAQIQLAPGDVLLVFSDGLSEAQSVTGEEYGEERLAEFAARGRHLSPGELRRAIYDEVDGWTGAQERGDDQTLVILKIN